jgi:hypothetical protein
VLEDGAARLALFAFNVVVCSAPALSLHLNARYAVVLIVVIAMTIKCDLLGF